MALQFFWLISQGPTPGPDAIPTIRAILNIWGLPLIAALLLQAIAALAMERKVGARGLRMILEDLMLDLMYYIPSYKKVREFQVTKEMVLAQKISLMLLEKAG